METILNTTYSAYDYDGIPYPEVLKSLPPFEIAIKAVFYLVIIVFSLFGNTLIIVIVYRHKRMRTATNFYIVNLAVADLLVTLSCTWVHFVDDITEGWILGTFFCRVNSFAHVLSLVASVLSLSLIAYDRFFGIVFAMKAHMSEKKAKTSLIFVWLCSTIVGCPVLVFRKLKSRQWANHLELWCDDDWPVEETFDPVTNSTKFDMPLRTAYYTGVSVVLFFVPLVVMTAAYSVIIWTLKTKTAPGEISSGYYSAQNRARKKVILMLLMILAVFAVCWLPFQVCLLYLEHRSARLPIGKWYWYFEFSARYLAYCNSALNPLIYAGFNDNFKQGIYSIFGCPKMTPRHVADGKSYGTYTTTMHVQHMNSGSNGIAVTAV
ncbi:substance-P receptor-like [Gigantopelta aegis]|uniref:substance-P receptor-like n=1 Tax=Gigantopelta aegis TaxID=1735272 RepID=UPI001B8881EC|nr:substance-P receptor-like [Gigantopelta aegis]